MQKLTETQSPLSSRVIQCTPEQLRMIADRLDQEARKVTQSGEYVMYSLSEKITLLYSPGEKK